MGAESSILEDCQWGPQVACPPKFPWEMSPVTKPDGTSATVFESKNSDNNKDEDFLRKFATTLRGLRHPNIIRFIGCGQSSDGFWLATEPVLPLFTFVSDMSSQELCAGLYDLLHGLDFLHSKLGVCHNNICLLSVYVSSDGSWKLGGLEHACKFTEATQEFLDRCRPHRHEDSLSPEEKTSRVKVDSSLGHARDVFAFGTLIDAVLDLVKEKDSCAQMLEQQLSLCLMADPSARPSVSSLLDLSVFRSDLIEVLNFLRHVTAKTDFEKKHFFSTLMPRLQQLPEMAIARRLVVALLARFVLLDEGAVAHVLPHFLTPKGSSCRKPSTLVQGLLPEHLFRQFVINHIYNIFHVYDCHVRLVLLEHFSHFVNMFTRQQLEDDIFIQILLGVRDTDDRLVAASLRALADLVPVLGGDVIVGGVRKPFFFHGMPKMSAHNLAKVNVPNNVMTLLKDHKPLLKNLALSSQSALDRSLAQKEKKMREREQRREEAKLRREERRNQQKEKQTDIRQEGNSVQEDCDGQRSVVIIEQGSDGQRSEVIIEQGSDGQRSEVIIEQGSDCNQEETLKSQTGKNETTADKESTLTDSNSLDLESVWSDWEDADKQISDEIEIELQALSSFMSAELKVQTSPSPYRSHSPPSPPPVKVGSWSEADNSTSGRIPGSLHLGVSRQAAGDGRLDPDVASAGTSVNDGHEGSTKTRLEPKQKNPNARSSSTMKENPKLIGTSSTKLVGKRAGDSRLTDDLGAGLDIKSINVVKKSIPPELDFFADMAPVIAESNIRVLTTLLVPEGAGNSSSVLMPVTTSQTELGPDRAAKSQLFAVSAVSEEEVKGWSEDDGIDWDNESHSVIQTDARVDI